jgi:hypothetical protein
MRKKFKYIKEYLQYNSEVLGLELGSLSSKDDGYYQMMLTDVDYIIQPNKTVILKVDFSEISDTNYNGKGVFKCVPADIEELSADVIPMDLTGILDDVFEENPEAIIDLVLQIYDEVKR